MTDWPVSTATRLLGVSLHDVPSHEALRRVCEGFLEGRVTRCIYTPNPEILLFAREHPDYAILLDQADLSLPDGFGIVLVQRMRRRDAIHKWAGVDVAELILRMAAARSARVMLLGGREGSGERAAARWSAELPGLDVVAVGGGVRFGPEGEPARESEAADLESRIDEERPAVIFVSLGHPKQERWIARHRDRVPGTRILMGVGGALDVWSGRVSRAPMWLRSLGLEWSWRLLQEPSRLPRILRATIEFPWRALTERAKASP